MSKQVRETRRVELVETHNLYLSLMRLQEGPYDHQRWKRALLHAGGMAGLSSGQMEKLRLALEMP